YEKVRGIRWKFAHWWLAHCSSALPRRFAAAESDAVSRGFCAAIGYVASEMASGGTSSLASPRADRLFLDRCGPPYTCRARSPRANREIFFRKNPGLCTLSKFDPTTGR